MMIWWVIIFIIFVLMVLSIGIWWALFWTGLLFVVGGGLMTTGRARRGG